MTVADIQAVEMEELTGSTRASTIVDLPRLQEGSSPQHLLVTLLGDYWLGRQEHLPSSALVDLLAQFGIAEAGARAAISRLSRRAVLEQSRMGRRTFYGLSRAAAYQLAVGAQRIMRFADEPDWDGTWTVVSFSVPEQHRDLRICAAAQRTSGSICSHHTWRTHWRMSDHSCGVLSFAVRRRIWLGAASGRTRGGR